MARQRQCSRHWLHAARTLLSLLIPSACLTALQPTNSVTQYGHTAWTREQGKLPGAVFAVTQTPDGSLWVGTEFGLFRFDGVTFSPWTPPGGKQLPSQEILALAPAQGGGLWIGTRSGLSYWNGQELRNYQTAVGTNSPTVGAIVVDHAGTVWVGTAGFDSGGICRIQAEELRCLSAEDGYKGGPVLAMFEDKEGSLWAGTADGLYQWNSGEMHRYGRGAFLAVSSSADGSVIAGGRATEQVAKLVDGRFVTLYPSTGRRAHVLLEDHDGALWIGTTGQGLTHAYQGRRDQFARADGLSGDTVFALFEDREGSLWVGTERGLDRLRDLPVTILSKREGLSSDTVGSVFASAKGGVWLGTTQGLNRVVNGRVTAYHTRDGLASETAESLFEDRSGTLWMDSPNGLVFFSGGRFHRLDLPGGQLIRSVAAAAQELSGALWLSDLDHGLILIEGTRIGRVIPWSQFGNRRAWELAADFQNGGLLLGFEEGGVARYDGGRVQAEYPTGTVTGIQVDSDETVWIATEGGLSRLRNGQMAMLTKEGGLPCEGIHAIAEADDGSLWLNTPCGLVRITRQDLNAWSADPGVKIKPTVLGVREGMHLRARLTGYFRRGAKSNDGRLWFPVFDGVAVVDPKHLRRNEVVPPVKIESILEDEVPRTIEAGISLPPISRGLEIDYTAFSFVDPDQVHFKYKLEGFDDEWINAGVRRRALYPNLPPDDYRFRVIASNNDGVWNEVGASLDFSVASKFYQTAWFKLLGVALIGAVCFGACRLRTRYVEGRLRLRFEERLKERARISRELHDNLLQKIAGLALHLDGLSKIVTAPAAAKDDLRELRREAESWVREVRESVSDLRLQAADEDDLHAAVRQIGEQLTEGKGMEFRVRATGDPRPVEPGIRRNLLKIVQEALRNAVAHSHATEITVDVSYADEYWLNISIRDNGLGFDADAAARKPGHWGLATMRERAQELGAQLSIQSSPGQGTAIEIWGSATAPSERIEHERQTYSSTFGR